MKGKTRMLAEAGVSIALAIALSYFKIPIGLNFGGFGGSIDLVMIPLVIFALKWGAGWGGDVNVASGAELECDSDHAVHGGGHRLVVASDGRLVVKSGALV
ncbi:MAG: energy-coupled thiamine transporter ThiT, partial [Firmicutes bacterium]|nr:energy-coupled thiamine transporter ThiT [Bacillota bacterium]